MRGSIRKIYDENGDFIRRSEFAQDITKQVNFQRDLIQANKDKTILISLFSSHGLIFQNVFQSHSILLFCLWFYDIVT